MIKKMILAAAVSSTLLLTGCATPYQQGMLFNKLAAPIAVTENSAKCDKIGESRMANYLGYFAFGDASISAAKKSAGITKVANVDYDFTSILGLYSTTVTRVCGE